MQSTHRNLIQRTSFALAHWRLGGALLALLAALLLSACGGGDSAGTGARGNGAGGIAAQVIWPGESSSLGASMMPLAGPTVPTNVVSVRLTASDAGSSFTPITATFAAADRAGSLAGIPVGTDRILTVEALDGSNSVLYQGQTGGITVTGGVTTGVTVTMTIATAGFAVTSPGSSPYASNTALTSLSGTCVSQTGDTVTIRLQLGGQTDLTQPCSSGTYIFDLSSAGWTAGFTANGPAYDFTLHQESVFGGANNTLSWGWTYDTVAPTGGDVTSPATLTSGGNSTTVTGNCEDGATVTATDQYGNTATTTCVGGTYSLTIVRLTDDVYDFTVSQADAAGNTEANIGTLQWTRDTSIPPRPLSIAVVTPAPVGSYLTATVSAVQVECDKLGTESDYTAYRVKVYEDGTLLNGPTGTDCGATTGVTDITGLTGTGTVDGPYTYTATQTRIATGVTSAERSSTYTRDTTPPAAPSLTSPIVVAAGATDSLDSGDTTIDLTGECESGATVTLGGAGADTSPCTNGTYTVSYTGVAGGPYNLTLTQTDAAQWTSLAATTLQFTINTSLPTTPTLAANPYTPTPPAPQTNAANPVYLQSLSSITVTCDSGLTNGLLIAMNGGSETAYQCPGATYTHTVTGGSEGKNTFTFRQTDGSNYSGKLTVVWWMDNTAATPTVTSANPATGYGVSNTITGACEPGATLTVSGSASVTGIACSGNRSLGDSGGTYSVTVNAYQDGNYTYNILQTDLAGNISTSAQALWNRTTPAPPKPVITSPAAEPTYAKDTLTQIAGTCGDPVLTSDPHTVSVSGAYNASTPCVDGAFSITITTPPSTDGAYDYYVSQTNGNTGFTSAAAKRTFVYDTVKPAVVQLTNPTVTPSVTANTTDFLLGGLCETGATVTMQDVVAGATSTQFCANGQFTFTVVKDPPGVTDDLYTFNLYQTDPAGNVSITVTQEWLNTSTYVPTPTIVSPTAMPVRTNNGTLTPQIPLATNGEVVITGNCEYDGALGANEINRVFLADGATDLLSPGASAYPYAADCDSSGNFTIALGNTTVSSRWVWDSVNETNLGGSWTAGAYTFTLVQMKLDTSGWGSALPAMVLAESAGVYVQVFVDATAPNPPVITTPPLSAGVYEGPGPITVAGTCDANTTVSISGVIKTSPAPVDCVSGGFSFVGIDEDTDGAYNYALQATDLTGNQSGTANMTWNRNSQLVPPPFITSPVSNPYLSNTTTLTLIGTCAAGMTVHLTGDATDSMACAGGGFQFQVTKPGGSLVIYNFTLYQEIGGTTSSNTSFTWHLDTTLPTLNVTYALPFDPGIDTSVTPLTNPMHDAVFEFNSPDVVTFECNLDDSGWSTCTSPSVHSGFAFDSAHSMRIRAKNAFGSFNPTEYVRNWVQRSYDTTVLYHLDETGAAATALDSSPYTGDTPSYIVDLTASGTTNVAGETGFDQARSLVATGSDHLTGPDQAHLAMRAKMTLEAFVSPHFADSNPQNKKEKVLASKWDMANQRPVWTWGFYRRGANMLMYFRTYTEAPDGLGGYVVQETYYQSRNLSGPSAGTNGPGVYHLAVTWNRGVVTFFEDGILINSVTAGAPGISLLPDGNGELYIGAGGVTGSATPTTPPTLDRFLDGVIDEIRFSQDVCYLNGYTRPVAPFDGTDCKP